MIDPGDSEDYKDLYAGKWGDPYTIWLKKLNAMPDDQFEQTNQVGTKEREVVHYLLKSIDERIFKKGEAPEDYPRYNLIVDINVIRGGEAIIIPCYDRQRDNRRVILRVARPKIAFKPPKKQPVPPPPPPPADRKPKRLAPPPHKEKRAFGAGLRDLWDNVNIFREQKPAAKEAEEIEKINKKFSTEHSERFTRGCRIQRECFVTMRDKGLQKYGYIPEIYLVSEPPRQFCVMEYSPGRQLIDWAQDKEDIELLTMLYSIIFFVEKSLHEHMRIHSDLKHSNFLVLENNLPVLLDFGHAKKLTEASITDDRVALGSILFIDPAHYQKSNKRSFPQDIYMLGTTMWCLWTRGEPAETAEMRHEDGSPNFEAIRAAFPDSVFPLNLRYIFNRAFSLDEKTRYQDISEFREDVGKAIQEWRKCATEKGNCYQPCQKIIDIEIEFQALKALMKKLGED